MFISYDSLSTHYIIRSLCGFIQKISIPEEIIATMACYVDVLEF
jgi:hypothetical protein